MRPVSRELQTLSRRHKDRWFQSASMRPVSREPKTKKGRVTSCFNPRPCGQSPERGGLLFVAVSCFNPRPCGQSPESNLITNALLRKVSIRVHAASLPRESLHDTFVSGDKFQSASMRPVSREGSVVTAALYLKVSIRVHAASLPREGRSNTNPSRMGFNPRPCGQSPERNDEVFTVAPVWFQSASMRPVSREAESRYEGNVAPVSIRVHAASLPRAKRSLILVERGSFNPRPCGQSPERKKN